MNLAEQPAARLVIRQERKIWTTGYYNYPWDCVLRYKSGGGVLPGDVTSLGGYQDKKEGVIWKQRQLYTLTRETRELCKQSMQYSTIRADFCAV
mgnify:CR=1 FL=1